MYEFYNVLYIVGTILFGGYFILQGINHFKNHAGLTAYAASNKLPSPGIAVYVTGVMLLLGGIGIIFDLYMLVALWLLVIFLIPTTFIMHAYWKISDPQARTNAKISFYKNLALLGAVLMMMY